MYLLDTHVLIWALRDIEKLSSQAAFILSDMTNDIHISAASFYEIHLKVAIGKMAPLHGDLADAVNEMGMTHLPITAHDAKLAALLPLVHRDPWDRLLVAQAKRLNLQLISKDTQLDVLGADRTW
jgi:PIN domain nuclease of toxin-antitoxin system